MSLEQLIVLASVQGLTEFLPVSSSGHLVLTSRLLGWPDQGLEIDIAVHAGTLFAVIVYLRRDLARLVLGLGRSGRRSTRPLAGMLIVATVPVGIAGFALHRIGAPGLRDPAVIAWATLVFGLALWGADRFAMTVRRLEHMTWKSALVIGLAQTLALIPGTSRAGITMTAARALGFERREAARFSLLLSIPAIAAAALLAFLDLTTRGDTLLTRDAALAAALAFAVALGAIRAMMAWLERSGFAPFAVYRLVLGGGLLLWLYV